ncbi:MAG: hypothetical protein AMS26_11985 [Bacteroides sp. SM23_62]|nr:MAG: hypothetical protein AMS26_11985 [Bacteroides sp. SM23_62]
MNKKNCSFEITLNSKHNCSRKTLYKYLKLFTKSAYNTNKERGKNRSRLIQKIYEIDYSFSQLSCLPDETNGNYTFLPV